MSLKGRAALGALTAAAILASAPALAAPQRVMSINGCTDLLVLQLLPPSRVVSVTYRARDAARAFAPGLADGVATNDGRAEEIVRARPDLVVAGRHTTPLARDFARRAGIPVVEIDDAASFADIRRNIRQLGEALGEAGRAAALEARLDAALAAAAAEPPARRWRVAAWNGGGIVPGRGTLADAIITAAGADNVAAGEAALGYGNFDLETLLQVRPDALLQGDPRLAAPTLREEQARHRLVRRLYEDRQIAIPETLYNCGLPQSAEAALALRRALGRLAGNAP